MKTKKCNECGETKPISEFHKINRGLEDKIGKTKLLYKCKECKKAYDRKRWNPVRYKIFDQDCCQICGTTYRLVADHNHNTGYIRGLLCNTCNRTLGIYHDNIKLFENMIAYITNNNNNTKYGKYSNPRYKEISLTSS